jgi:hypothetical protein
LAASDLRTITVARGGNMRTMVGTALALLLSGCSWMGPDETITPVPSQADLESGDCHALANEHASEAAWSTLDAESQQRVSKVAYDDCQQWKSTHAWSGNAQ